LEVQVEVEVHLEMGLQVALLWYSVGEGADRRTKDPGSNKGVPIQNPLIFLLDIL
jgi:hypothetical protein